MYLLRLIAQTKSMRRPALEMKTQKRVLAKLNKFVRGGTFEQMEVDWIEDAQRSGLFTQLGTADQNELLDTLYQVSQSSVFDEALQERALQVYKSIIVKNARGQKKQAKRS